MDDQRAAGGRSDWFGLNTQDTTLYLIELTSELTPPTGIVTVSPDQFTWVVKEYQGVTDIAPNNLDTAGKDVCCVIRRCRRPC